MDDNKDLLDLCRLNLMEENVTKSPGIDRDVTLKAIDMKKRDHVTNLLHRPSPIGPDAQKNHVYRNYEEESGAKDNAG